MHATLRPFRYRSRVVNIYEILHRAHAPPRRHSHFTLLHFCVPPTSLPLATHPLFVRPASHLLHTPMPPFAPHLPPLIPSYFYEPPCPHLFLDSRPSRIFLAGAPNGTTPVGHGVIQFLHPLIRHPPHKVESQGGRGRAHWASKGKMDACI